MQVPCFSAMRVIFRNSRGCSRQRLGWGSFHTASSCRQEETSGSSGPLIVVENYKSITVLGLNRPLKRNALNDKLLSALRNELKLFESNNDSTVAVLHGVGGNFCAGLDLVDQSSSRPSIPLVDEFCSKPVIAAVNGYAVGEGFDLAMACDLRIMDELAVLGSFNRRFGVTMSESALLRLSACCGLAFTLDIILSGRPITAAEAFQRGLVQSITPCGTSKGNSLTYAQSLTKFPQAALRADRAALYQSLSLSEEIQKAVLKEKLSMLQAALKDMPSQKNRFSEGIGKHGTFKDLTIQSDRPDWMKK